jgi:hypothetical protein
LKIEVGPAGSSVAGSPSPADFLKIWDKVMKGGSFKDGVDGSGGVWKCDNMLKCLGESILERDRRALKECKVIGIQRDEADGRMWFRFRAISPDLKLIQGVLGHARKDMKGGKGILFATDKVFVSFCTPRLGIDPNAKLDKRLTSRTPRAT